MRRIGTLALLCGLLLFAALAQTVDSGRGLPAPVGLSAALCDDTGGDPGGLFAADDDPIACLGTGASPSRLRLSQIAPAGPSGDSIDLTPPGPVPRGA